LQPVLFILIILVLRWFGTTLLAKNEFLIKQLRVHQADVSMPSTGKYILQFDLISEGDLPARAQWL